MFKLTFLRKNLEATTIIESLLALMVISIISALTFSFITNFEKSTNAFKKLNAYYYAKHLLEKTIDEKMLSDDVSYINQFTLKKNIHKLDTDNRSFLIVIDVFEDDSVNVLSLPYIHLLHETNKLNVNEFGEK